MSPAACPLDLLTVEEIGRLLGFATERRETPRFPYQATLRVAPVSDEDLPPRTAFRHVLCKDISMGGISFYLAAEPAFAQVVVELGREWFHLLVKAEVLGSHPVLGLEPYHLVRCRFIERIK